MSCAVAAICLLHCAGGAPKDPSAGVSPSLVRLPLLPKSSPSDLVGAQAAQPEERDGSVPTLAARSSGEERAAAACPPGMRFKVGSGCIYMDGMPCLYCDSGEAPAIDLNLVHGEGSGRFDRQAALDAIRGIDLSTCKKNGRPTGTGHVTVVFVPTGDVLYATVDQPPLAGTAEGACIGALLLGVHVAKFGGPAVQVGAAFTL
jgi:hypothetical protein